MVVNSGLRETAGAHGRDEGLSPRAGRAGHDQVEQPVTRRGKRSARIPVRYHDPVEAPLVLEDVPKQRVLGHRGAVHRVVRGHDRPGAGVANDRLERSQIQLPQRAFVDHGVDREPFRLRVVGNEMLDGRPDATRLYAAHVCAADSRREQRVLGEAFEVPAAERRAVQIDRRSEQDIDALAACLARQQKPDALHSVFVPGCRERCRRRNVGRRVPLVPPLATNPRRPVGCHDPAQPDRWLGVQCPDVGTGEQTDLLLQAQPAQPGHHFGLVESVCGRGNFLRGHPCSHRCGW